MVELGGLLAAAILKVVSDQIGAAIGGQIKLHKDFTKDLEKMKMTLESVEALLQDAERRSVTDHSTRLWLKRLKDAMYVIADTIDEYESDAEAITKPSVRKFSPETYMGIVIPCLTIGPKIEKSNKIKKSRQDLEVITDEHNKFKFSSRGYTNELKNIDIRETSSVMETQLIFGRKKERETILCSLSQSLTKEITILPIYGIGGLGKTTLAKMVYNSSQFKDYTQLWVYVSASFDLKKIGNSIISQLSERKSQHTEMQMIHNSLSKLLAGKKILVVLDDMWENSEPHLDSLKAMLKVGKESNVVVLVTTRVKGIAQKISTIQPHRLEPLTDDMCWSIIKQKSEFESRDDKEQLESKGMDIAMKCGGVALAAQSLGHMLHSMTSSEWESVRTSDIWNISTLEDMHSTHVLASLRLSYSVMSPYLKLCFAYCALFPKGHKIVKDDLIHQWVSLGFIEPTNIFSFWQVGERYISQLLGLSFLQDSKSPLAAEVYHEDFTLLIMHDLVHDLARSVMLDEILVADEHGNTRGSCYHYALLNDSSKPLESSKIRALRFMDCGEIELDSAPFSSAKSLRILDLSECSIHKLPNYIGLLKQLRYLNAPRVQHATIPNNITRLSKLTYLNLNGSSAILALPKSIGDIEGLLYIDLSGCSGLKNLPKSFGRLTKLVHLDLSNCSSVEDISLLLGNLTKLQHLNLSYCPNIGELPAGLGGLFELRYLNLSFSSYLRWCIEPEVLETLTKLNYLNLSSEDCSFQKLPEALGSFSELKYLNISGLKNLKQLPTVTDNLRKLRYLNLSRCIDSTFAHNWWKNSARTDSFLNSISALSNLEHLDLSHNNSVHSIPANLCNLRKLHTLDLSECSSLFRIPESIGTMDSLKFLYLDTISEPPQLGSNAITLPHFVVYTRDGESSSNLVLLQDKDPVVLHITRLENVETAEEAQSINLIGKQSMTEMELEWTSGAERYVDDKLLLEKLVPPITLKSLVIGGYNSSNLPAWLMGITHYLPNISRIELCNLPNCNVIPPLSQLPKLNSLVLSGLNSLEEWSVSYSSGEEHVLEKLVIADCPKMRIKTLPWRARRLEISNSDSVLSSWGEYTGASSTSYYPVDNTLHVGQSKLPIHQWRFLQHLPGLTCLEIIGCGDLTGSPDIIQHLSSLKSLLLEDRDKEELPEWLGELTSLQELKIEQCRGLKELHESMRQLTELQSLKLSGCSSITSLPHCLGELRSLKEVIIWCCDAIRSLPECIQQLTNLQELNIYSCPSLKKWCDLEEENEMKLTPNHERACVLPTSLNKFVINSCDGISSLPDGIHQLTNLQKLKICRCPALKKWCELEENKAKLAHIKSKSIR